MVLARLGLVVALAVSCGDDPMPVDAGGGAAADAAPPDAASCVGSPAGGCEIVVDTADQCPTVEEVCAGVCSAAYDCCYCEPPEWQTIFIDCPPCIDAGSD